jgi:single-strand DNA-binding protein
VRNKAAEICENICQKGIKYIEGRIKSRQWQTEDGTTKHTSEIQVTEFTSTKRQRKQQTNWQFWIHKNTNFDAQNNGLPINDFILIV